MGLVFRKKVKVGKTGKTWVNLSRSGASVSRRIGDRVTVNSRGRVTIRIAPGISWRIGR